MKNDISIPKVSDVHVVIVQEEHPEYKTLDWNAYIINNKTSDLDMVLIVSKGYDDNRETSIMRHKIEKLPAKSFAKIELIQTDVLELNNEFKVTFFEGNQMFDKTYVFKKNTIIKKNLQLLPVMTQKGVLAND